MPLGCLVAAASRWWSLVDEVIAAGLGAEGPLRDRVSFRWWISFLRQGQGGYWGSHLTTPQVHPCSLRDTAHPSPGPPPPITLMPHPPLHYQPCPLESLKDPVFWGSLGGPPNTHTHSLEDPALLQAVFATIPHGGVVHSLNGPVNGLEDILLQALWGAGVGS